MGEQAQPIVQTNQVSSAPSHQNNVLQRTCACGQHVVGGGECESCRKKQGGTIQRAAINTAPITSSPQAANSVPGLPGEPFDTGTSTFRESRFTHDFSQMPTHSTPSTTHQTKPAASRRGEATEQEAFAEYTEGRDINNMLANDGGQPLDRAIRTSMESSFGYDFSHVRTHTGARAAESARSINARAYTVEQDIVFGEGAYAPETAAGKYLLAHELTHVVQQGTMSAVRHGLTRPAVTVSSPTDATETEANRVANQVLHHQAPVVQSHRGRRKQGIVYRFESTEHLKIGTAAFGDHLTDLNYGTDREPAYLTYGEMVALAGDYFASLDEMRKLASRSAGRDKIRWARWKALYEKSEPEPAIDPTLKKEVMDHYYTLAAGNVSHFSAGGTALDSYRSYHWQALEKAYDAGYNSSSNLWGEAMTIEAFGAHYLTDMFSAGHVRTPRQDMKTWYTEKFPDSIHQFITYMAQIMHTFLANAHPYQGFAGEVFGMSDEPALEKTIRELGGSALEAFSLGDIVSIGFHDKDSEGLQVVSGVDEAGKEVKGGFRFRATGDTHLSESSKTENMAVAATRASIADLETIRKKGSEVLHIGVYSTLRMKVIEDIQPFAAERYIPHEDISAANIEMNWHWGKFDKNMRDAVDKAVKGKVANALDEKAKAQQGVKREALENFVALLRRRGIQAIENAIGASAGGGTP